MTEATGRAGDDASAPAGDASTAAGDTEPVVPDTHVVAMLRERLYGAISCLATLAVLTRYTGDETSGWDRMIDVAVTMGGLWLASLLSDFVAHLSVYGHAPRGVEGWRMLQASGQILEASVLPLGALATAGLGLLDTDTAVWIAKWILVVELGVIALLAVRKTALPWWQQTLTVLSLVALGLLVIAIKVLAH